MKPKQKSGVHERKIGHREKAEATPPKLSQFCGRHEQDAKSIFSLKFNEIFIITEVIVLFPSFLIAIEI
jgi:hypothetical protein